MKRGVYTSLAVLAVWWGAGANFAAAQSFGSMGQRGNPFTNPSVPFGQPGFNNYGFNTYGILRAPSDPLNALRLNPDGSLQGQIGTQGAISALGGLQTGHATTFFDYSQYFPLNPYGSTTGSNSLGAQGFGAQGFANQGQGQVFGPSLNNPTAVFSPQRR